MSESGRGLKDQEGELFFWKDEQREAQVMGRMAPHLRANW